MRYNGLIPQIESQLGVNIDFSNEVESLEEVGDVV